MVKIRELILLAITLAIGLAGCGDSSRGYAIFRSRALVTVFIPLPDTSEIADVKVDNKSLHLDIDTGEKIVPREIKLQRRLFKVVEPDETVEIHGKNRINDYAVIHLRAFDRKYKVSRFIKLYAHAFYYDPKGTSARKEPQPFGNSGAFRFGDKIVAYCRLQDDIDSQSKGIKINIGGVEVKRTVATVNTHMITEDEIGKRLLIIEKYQIDSDKTIRDLHFRLKALGPDETVKIEDVKTLGNKIAIVELAVEPREAQPPKPPVPERISDR